MTVWDFALQNESDGIEFYSAKAEETKRMLCIVYLRC